MLRFAAALVVLSTFGCATSRKAAMEFSPMTFDASPTPAAPLVENHFARDRTAIAEPELRAILAAPVYLEENARVGVLPVAARYEVSDEVPVQASPAEVVAALEGSGLVELATEVSSEWPIERGLPGLRELAARYRTEYLLLMRHRFVDSVRANPAAAAYVTLVAALFVPGTTVETTGVLEATLFDVKTGTILFTIHERVRGEVASVPLAVDLSTERQHQRLVGEGTRRLADEVLARMRRLVASRPAMRGEASASLHQSALP
ncbi:MAG: hypothetical protein MUC96_17265 [Myxococcaceae bacterium]|jgi:hypothetical protein|nr:hypothetical protein [Myxococcaceae bacterium]